MRAISGKRLAWVLVLGLGVAGLAWFAWPRPVAVDLAAVIQAPMEVTADDDGKTRVRHIYAISAPVAGKVLRISLPSGDHEGVSRHVGDQVTAGQTVVAVMQPTLPGFLDARSREQIEAEIAAADAALKQSEAEVRRLEAALAFSRAELQRAQSLTHTQTISAQAYDKAKFDAESNEAALASAKAQIEVRRGVRASLAARLMDPLSANVAENPACCVQIRAPVTGRVLKIVQESEAVVPAGTPLIEIGDPLDLEVVADLLSTDAVQISPGAPVRIDGWGGTPIKGRVRRVDPAGFLKVSALGIEEQRVRVTIDFADPPESWSRLGHDYRVIVHVTVWSADGALTVPVGALFRKGDDWAVFAVRDGRVRTELVQIGHRNNRVAEVVSGLASGCRVVLHPSDRVSEGTRVAERETR
jgi:HlyD family secretion protein